MTIRDRLNVLISHLKLSKNEFAREIGSSGAMVSKITTKEVNFGIDVFKKIIDRYPQLNHQWLMSGEGEMWNENHNNETPLDTQLSKKGTKSGKEYIQQLAKQFPSDYKPLTEDERKLYKENRKLIERSKQKLINELIALQGNYEGLFSVIDNFAAVSEILRQIETHYLEEFDDVLFHADAYVTSGEFNYKQYKSDALEKLKALTPFKSPFNTLLKGVNQFAREFKEVDTENILEEYYEQQGIK